MHFILTHHSICRRISNLSSNFVKRFDYLSVTKFEEIIVQVSLTTCWTILLKRNFQIFTKTAPHYKYHSPICSYDDGVNCCAPPYANAGLLRPKASVSAIAFGSNSYPDQLATITGSANNVYTMAQYNKLALLLQQQCSEAVQRKYICIHPMDC